MDNASYLGVPFRRGNVEEFHTVCFDNECGNDIVPSSDYSSHGLYFLATRLGELRGI